MRDNSRSWSCHQAPICTVLRIVHKLHTKKVSTNILGRKRIQWLYFVQALVIFFWKFVWTVLAHFLFLQILSLCFCSTGKQMHCRNINKKTNLFSIYPLNMYFCLQEMCFFTWRNLLHRARGKRLHSQTGSCFSLHTCLKWLCFFVWASFFLLETLVWVVW